MFIVDTAGILIHGIPMFLPQVDLMDHKRSTPSCLNLRTLIQAHSLLRLDGNTTSLADQMAGRAANLSTQPDSTKMAASADTQHNAMWGMG